jgi:hypothetical protein
MIFNRAGKYANIRWKMDVVMREIFCVAPINTNTTIKRCIKCSRELYHEKHYRVSAKDQARHRSSLYTYLICTDLYP